MPGRTVSRVGGVPRNAGLRVKLAGEAPTLNDEECWGYPWQQSPDSYSQPADFNREPLRPWRQQQQQQLWEQQPASQVLFSACRLALPPLPPAGLARPPVHYSAPAVRLAEADMDLGTPPPPGYAVQHSQKPAAAPPPWQQRPPWQQQRPPWQQQLAQHPPWQQQAQQPLQQWGAPQVYASVASRHPPAQPAVAMHPPLPILPGQQQRTAPPAAPPLHVSSAAPPGKQQDSSSGSADWTPGSSRAAAGTALQPPPVPARTALQPPPAPPRTALQPPPAPPRTPLPPLPAATPPPMRSEATPPPPLPDSTPPPKSVAAPLPPDTMPPPLPLGTPPPAPADAAEAASTADDVASPVVPEFIRQLWKQHQKGQSGECAAVAAPAVHASASSPPPQPAAPSSSQAGAAKAAASAVASEQEVQADEVQQAGAKVDVEEGEIAGEPPAACPGSSTPQLPPGIGLAATTSASEHSASRATASSRSYSHRSKAGPGDSRAPRRRSRSRGRQSSRTSRGQRERSFSSSRSCSSRSSSQGEHSSRRRSSRGRHHRRHGGSRRHGSGHRHRRRSRSPLRRVGRSDAACKRRPAASAALVAPRDAQLSLTTLVESMSAEAASLHRQLGRLTVSDVPAGAGGGQGADVKASSSKKSADSEPAPAPSATADMERQLAVLSSKLGQLTLLVQQPNAVAQPGAFSTRDSREHEGVTCLVFDTNVWMDALALLRDCWKGLVASGCTTVRFLVPLAVMRELDGLKKCFFRGFWARKAISKLADMQGHRALRGQREDELHRGMLRRNDDGILDCLLYFRARGAQVEFVSKDVHLCVRARNEGFLTTGPMEARERLLQRLRNEAAGGSAAAKEVAPKYPAPPTSR